MNVTLADNAGFCPGVKRADLAVKRLIDNNNGKIFTLGELIHNRLYNENLEKKGVLSTSIDELCEMLAKDPQSHVTLVIRTHGVTKAENEMLLSLAEKHPNFKLIDMTCAYVKRIHRIAEENTNDNTVFLLYCDKNHPEAKGIISYAKGEKYMFSNLEELETTDFGNKTPILCSQTTQNQKEFKKIKNFFEKLYTNLIFFDTICSVTQIRQDEAVLLSQKSDAMIVIGGKNSSNTKKLYDLCSQNCPVAIHIESAEELFSVKLPKDTKNIGITAGASTPDDIILEVLKQWKKN